ncbi:MAG: homocysteine S-methyltransferase family protein [Crocinitomicaceae bacterium]|nr:homocysteine S-methyltransferase family protein [Crocinitomicaceae bacterium]
MQANIDIKEIIKEKILVLDGAMGTMIQTYNLEEKDFRGERFKDHHMPLQGNNDILALTRPDVLKAIHISYLEAGADIIETNTFGGTFIAQEDYDLAHAVFDINFESAKIAREAANEFTAKNPEKPRFVCGSMGPTTKLSSMSPDVNDPGFRSTSFEELVQAFKEQVTGLIKGGVDLLMVETITDTLNAKAALFAIETVQSELSTDLPVMISGTITDASGRTLSGQNTEAFIVSVQHSQPLTIGLNCAMGASGLRPYLSIIRNKFDGFVHAHPNAGLPNEMGDYDETPEETAAQIKVFLEEGLVNIIGGCCGTTPAHIKAIADLAENYQPYRKKDQDILVNA